MTLTHFDAAGQAHMVDISAKSETAREAVATGCVIMTPETLSLAQGARPRATCWAWRAWRASWAQSVLPI